MVPCRICIRLLDHVGQKHDGFYSDASVVEPVRLDIIADEGLLQLANDLLREMSNAFRLLPWLQTAEECSCTCPTFLNQCPHYRRSVLIVLCRSQLLSSGLTQLIPRWISNAGPNAIVLPILPEGADPAGVLPNKLNRRVVVWRKSNVSSVVPDVLRAAGIGDERFRLFISYRRVDAQELAEQIYDRFSHDGFDVFLDRFRGAPGIEFPQQLSHALVDRGLVLVIESPNVWKSKWTMAEVLFAKQFRLGLMAIRIPKGSEFQCISDRDRFRVEPGEWNSISAATSERLTQSGLDRLIEFVRSRYAPQILRRRVYLETLLGRVLHAHSLQAMLQANGTHLVSQNGNDYTIELASKQPRLENFRRAAETLSSHSRSHRVVVGPIGFDDPKAKSDLKWLGGQLNVASIDEAMISRLAWMIRSGASIP